MSNRSWFFASQGQQQGPYPEAQLREFVASGTISRETLVWTEGMANWQRAADIPGLLGGASGPPGLPVSGGALISAGHGGPLSIDFGILAFVWRSLVFAIGCILIIPAPWVVVWYLRWIVPCVQVPGRPNLSFTGTAMTIVPWYFGAIVLLVAVSFIGIDWLNQLTTIVQIVLYWLFLKWIIANLASNGQPLGLSFSGSIWAYIGWTILTVISILTIIGWAWVYVAWMRWVCRNIQGTRREVVFIGSGLEFLWRAVVALLACLFIIPIPWMYLWIMRWLASQTVLADRNMGAARA